MAVTHVSCNDARSEYGRDRFPRHPRAIVTILIVHHPISLVLLRLPKENIHTVFVGSSKTHVLYK
jgi:hypothetical protein